jgi:RNA polymerase sigma factor (sigma-70 family)
MKKEFYVTINGERVIVSEEIYRAYIRPVRAEQRRMRRQWKCCISVIRNGKSKLIRCPHECDECEYAKAGRKATGNHLSLDGILDEGIEIEDRDYSLGGDCIAKTEQAEEAQRLHNAISQLTVRQQEMVRMVYFEGKTQDEVAEIYGIKKQSVSDAMQRIYATLKKIL